MFDKIAGSPKVLDLAGKSPLHVISLVVILLVGLAQLLFAGESLWPRLIVFALLLLAAVMLGSSLLKIAALTRDESKPIVEPSVDAGAEIQLSEELSAFLGIRRPKDFVGIYIPTTECLHEQDEFLAYRANTVSVSHMQAVMEIVHWLGINSNIRFEPQHLFIREGSIENFSGSALFAIGGPLSNALVREIVPIHANNGQNAVAAPIYVEDSGSRIRLVCHGISPDDFAIEPPRGNRSIDDVEAADTYGCINYLPAGEFSDRHTTIAIWGLDARGTRGAARWLANNWRTLAKKNARAAIIRLSKHKFFQADDEDVVAHPFHRGVLVPADSRYQ